MSKNKDDGQEKPASSPSPTPPAIEATPGESPSRAVVRKYLAYGDYARTTGDTRPMESLTTPGCESCEGELEYIHEVFDAGGHYEGDYEQEIVELNGETQLIIALIKDGGWKTIVPKKPAQEVEGGQTTLNFVMKKVGNQWRIAEIGSSGRSN